MQPGPKPAAFKLCDGCGAVKPRAEFYKKLATLSHKCKPCTRIDLKKRAPNYYGKYREYVNAWRRDKYKNDPAFRARNRATARRYISDLRAATPPWADLKAIRAFYRKKPKGMQVDHIIPLRGFIDGHPVSGLHVQWNLQYLTPVQNGKKRNLVTSQDIESISISSDYVRDNS